MKFLKENLWKIINTLLYMLVVVCGFSELEARGVLELTSEELRQALDHFFYNPVPYILIFFGFFIASFVNSYKLIKKLVKYLWSKRSD